MDFYGFVCKMEKIPWLARSSKAMLSDSRGEGRNLCSERAFHHRHLRKLYKIILAPLCRKITQKSWDSCVECVRLVTLVLCSYDAHTFFIPVEEGWLDPHRCDQLAVSAEEMRGTPVEKTSPGPER